MEKEQKSYGVVRDLRSPKIGIEESLAAVMESAPATTMTQAKSNDGEFPPRSTTEKGCLGSASVPTTVTMEKILDKEYMVRGTGSSVQGKSPV